MSKKTNALRLLDAQKARYETVEYHYDADDLSVEHIAKDNGLPLARIFKTLVAKGDKNGVAVAVVPGHKNLDFKALAKASGNKKMALVPVKDIQGLTGYIRGGCSPIGMKKDYPVYLDISALDYEAIYVNAGQRGLLVGLSPEALRQATGAVVENIAE
ncbi:MAG: Cys-tRNA(Pro) deacylase [Phaeodactylibacter sp.]|nr:Cys-tRNA(Pro) deacylase [Phaeodactylibacter sp.]MCB9054007.1 Cys-tRNA(Pro) deacylase [Lewinellaceae bacterium]